METQEEQPTDGGTPTTPQTEGAQSAPETQDWSIAEAVPEPTPPPKPTKKEIMESIGCALKFGEIMTDLGAAMVVVCFAGDGVGVMQMLSPTVTMSDQDLVKFVKVMEQAVEQCKDTINKRRPGVLPCEGPIITDIRSLKGGIRALPRRR